MNEGLFKLIPVTWNWGGYLIVERRVDFPALLSPSNNMTISLWHQQEWKISNKQSKQHCEQLVEWAHVLSFCSCINDD